MKLTKQQLKQFIKEELSNILMENEAVVPPPKVQDIIEKNSDIKVEVSKSSNGRILEYKVSPTAVNTPISAAHVADKIAEVGVELGFGPDSVACDDTIRRGMGFRPTGICRVYIGTHAGNVGNY